MAVRMRRTEKVEDTRRKLLAAARRVFLRRGFHSSSLDLVAEEAGFTKGVVYSRFASKADLFLAILEERIEQRIAEMRAAVTAVEGLFAVATVLSRQWDERLRQDEQWSLLSLEFRLHAARDPSLNQRYAALHAKLVGAMAALIADAARSAGETLAAPAEDLARAALAIGTGAILERCADPQAFPPNLTEMVQIAMVRGGGLAPAAPAATSRKKRTA